MSPSRTPLADHPTTATTTTTPRPSRSRADLVRQYEACIHESTVTVHRFAEAHGIDREVFLAHKNAINTPALRPLVEAFTDDHVDGHGPLALIGFVRMLAIALSGRANGEAPGVAVAVFTGLVLPMLRHEVALMDFMTTLTPDERALVLGYVDDVASAGPALSAVQ